MKSLSSSIVAFTLFGALALSEARAQTVRASVDSAGVQGDGDCERAAISANGRFVIFSSRADDLVPNDTNGCYDVFVHDLLTRTTERVSVSSTGVEGDFDSGVYGVAISADGRMVAFSSEANDLVAVDMNGASDVFVHDRATGVTECVSIDASGVVGNAPSGDRPNCVALSADGSLVAFESVASTLTAGDTNGVSDVFVFNLISGLMERSSVDSLGGTANGPSAVEGLSLSADGRTVAFDSKANNLVGSDGNGASDIFVHDRLTGITSRMSVDSSGSEGDQGSFVCSLSADGSLVAFDSDADNLVAGDHNTVRDVFVHDRNSGVTERASVDSSGAEGDVDSFRPKISDDGSAVAFESFADDLIGAADTNHAEDVFVRVRATSTTERVSLSSAGGQGNDQSRGVSISADGGVVAFITRATNLVPGDTNGFDDVLLHCSIDATWFNYGSGYAGTFGVPAFTARQDPVLGTTITLDLGNSLAANTFALLFLGLADASLPTSAGGTLLVSPFLTLPVALPAAGLPIPGALPNDPGLWGESLYLQALESDVGAAHKISFTRGLRLVFGY